MKGNRYKSIIRTSVVGIVANILLAAFKSVAGFMASSVAIIMDGVNNLSDALSSVITIVGTKLSQKPWDIKHPFGHGRVEYFSAIIISVIVITAGVTSLIESVKKMIDPTTPEYTTVTLIVIVTAIIVKLLLGQYVKRKGKELESDALIASGTDALGDAVLTLSTLVSAGIMLIWGVSLDGILGILISLYIIKAGIEMLVQPVNQLIGTRIPEEIINSLKHDVMSFDEVSGVYDIILHNYGPELMIGSLHIAVPDTLSAYDIHGLTRRITEKVARDHNILLTIGIYSVSTADAERNKLQSTVLKAVAKHKEIIQTHGFYYNDRDHSISVDVVPDISVTNEKALSDSLHDEIQALLPGYTIYIVVDHNYS